MRKVKVLLMMITVLFLVSCAKTEHQPLAVYSVSGENELFEVANGVIVLSDENDIFSGGDLKLKSDLFEDVTYCATTFYLISGNERETLMSFVVEDQTGGKVNIWGELGKISGKTIIDRTKISAINDLENALYFELSVKYTDGKENTYQLPMSVKEITKTDENK